MSTAELAIDGLTRRYSAQSVIGPVSFSVAQGEFVSLLGPSGCGKTTTLRCIAGFEVPDAGSIRLGDKHIERDPPNRRNVGLVFQSYALFPHLTVADNVAFGLRLRKTPKAERNDRVRKSLELVGLAHLAERQPRHLSGGQQQRVAIARSIVLEPRVLLFDEPLSNLDFKLRLTMRTELKALQRRLGKTTIYVTHDQGEALSLSDRIVVMSNGRIEQIGTPRQIYEEPASAFVADFIGNSNLVPVEISDSRDGSTTVTAEGGLRLFGRGQGMVGAPMLALIRPEHLLLRPSGASSENLFQAAVEETMYLGQDFQMQVRAPGGLKLAVVVAGSEAGSIAPGDDVTLSVAREHVLVLPQ